MVIYFYILKLVSIIRLVRQLLSEFSRVVNHCVVNTLTFHNLRARFAKVLFILKLHDVCNFVRDVHTRAMEPNDIYKAKQVSSASCCTS